MTNARTRIALMLAALLALGLGSAGRAAAEAPAGFSQPELDQMLAPIALYPDSVLSHVLIAATYPLEVVQAARWSRANRGLEGEYAVAAVEHYPWDPSVMALVAFPDLLARMDADLEWTQRLGDAFLIQEYQVLDTVQYLRDEAYASGHLRSNEYVRVVRETEYIYIEPSVSRVVYVPWYDPYTVYGKWRWSAYPPVHWYQPRGYRSGFSFHWSNGHRLEYGFFFSAVHWPSHRLVVHDHYGYYQRHDKHYGKRYGKHGYGGPRFASGRELARFDGARHWKHDQAHRRGVAYRRGIDERHTMRASEGSSTAGRSQARQSSRSDNRHDNRNDNRHDNRRDLLSQGSRSKTVPTQRSASASADPGRRVRPAEDRTNRSRNSIRRDANSILGMANRESAEPGQSEHGSDGKTASRRQSTSDRRSAVPNGTSSRRELTQRRASTARPTMRSNSSSARTGRAPAAQPRSSIRQSASRPSFRSTPQSADTGRDTRRTIHSRSRQSADSVRSDNRRGRQAIPRKSTPRAENRARPAGTTLRPARAKAPEQARSGGVRSRAEVLRSRGRDRRR